MKCNKNLELDSQKRSQKWKRNQKLKPSQKTQSET